MKQAVAVLADRVVETVAPFGDETRTATPGAGHDAAFCDGRRDRARGRLGALALGLSAVLLGVFPLVRPFFRLDVFAPEATLAAASSSVASVEWLIAHLMALSGFVLLLGAFPALYAHLAAEGDASPLFRALTLSVLGVALILPMLGVETYAIPTIGQIYLDGQPGIAPIVGLIYRGLGTLIMLLGLLALAIGVFIFAAVVWRRDTLPRWATIVWAAGLAAWLPLLPRPIRVIDGLLIGVGGVRLAWALWRRS